MPLSGPTKEYEDVWREWLHSTELGQVGPQNDYCGRNRTFGLERKNVGFVPKSATAISTPSTLHLARPGGR